MSEKKSRGSEPLPRLTFHPLTPERWPDLEKLFGNNGACGGCWCMWLRLPRKDFVAGKGEGNRRALKAIVKAGEVPGILAYAGAEPVGWCAVAPREAHPLWDRSRNYKRIDEKPVWAVSCFYVARPYRKRGMTQALIGAAAAYAKKHGATMVEGYPTDSAKLTADPFVWSGTLSSFAAAGFQECARRSPSRPMVRLALK
jgi:GNAT superfamily N-acetyltransferase